MTVDRPLLVVVPAHDEAENLPAVIEGIAAARLDADLLVVDDGSSDATARVARELGATVVSHGARRGYGAALVTGYRYALAGDYRTVVLVDGDGQHDPAQVRVLLAPLATGSTDAVVGSRMLPGGGHEASWPRRLGIHLFASIGRALSGQPITDPTSGFCAFNRRAVRFLVDHTPDDFPDVNVLCALHRAGVRVVEVPVTMRRRLSGRSQMRGLVPLLYVPKMLSYLRALYREPTEPAALRRRA